MKKSIILLAMGAMLLFLGCAHSEAKKNIENARRLRVGMTKSQVGTIMGDPLKEEFCTPDIWYYFVETIWIDGLNTEDECIPLVFKDGRLIGWGHQFLSNYTIVREKKAIQSEDVKEKKSL